MVYYIITNSIITCISHPASCLHEINLVDYMYSHTCNITDRSVGCVSRSRAKNGSSMLSGVGGGGSQCSCVYKEVETHRNTTRDITN